MAFYDCNNLLEIYASSKRTIECDKSIFSNNTYNNAYLFVPAGRKFAYEKAAPWNNFYIIEMDFTSIGNMEIDKSNNFENNIYYDLSGRHVKNPGKGIYIVNGKKMFVK